MPNNPPQKPALKSTWRYAALALIIMVTVGPRLVYTQISSSLTTGVIVGSNTSTIRNPGVAVTDNSVLSAYTKPNLTRLWYNSFQNRWDGVVPRFDDASQSSDHFIVKDVRGSQTFTDVKLEDRDFGRPDLFWDETNRNLYVFGSHPVSSELWRLGYDPDTDTYSFEVGALGAGVVVPGITHPNDNLGGNSPASIYVTPNGDVWVSVMKGDGLLGPGLQVQHSADGGATWLAAPITLNPLAMLGVTVWTHFQIQGTTYVGVFAAENGEGGLGASRFYFRYIDQTADPTVLANWIDDSPPQSVGVEQSDDHVSAARDTAGNMYFAVKTEGGNPTDPLIKLYRRTPTISGERWSQYKVTETQES